MCLVCLPETTCQRVDQVPEKLSGRRQMGPWSLPPEVEPCPAPSSPTSRPPCLHLSMPPAPPPRFRSSSPPTGAAPQCWQHFAAPWPLCGAPLRAEFESVPVASLAIVHSRVWQNIGT